MVFHPLFPLSLPQFWLFSYSVFSPCFLSSLEPVCSPRSLVYLQFFAICRSTPLAPPTMVFTHSFPSRSLSFDFFLLLTTYPAFPCPGQSIPTICSAISPIFIKILKFLFFYASPTSIFPHGSLFMLFHAPFSIIHLLCVSLLISIRDKLSSIVGDQNRMSVDGGSLWLKGVVDTDSPCCTQENCTAPVGRG